MARSHTKKGPGRQHGQCRLIVDPTNGNHLGVMKPQQRLAPAIYGGNWQGVEYFTLREHDYITRRTRFVTPYQVTRADAIKAVKDSRH